MNNMIPVKLMESDLELSEVQFFADCDQLGLDLLGKHRDLKHPESHIYAISNSERVEELFHKLVKEYHLPVRATETEYHINRSSFILFDPSNPTTCIPSVFIRPNRLKTRHLSEVTANCIHEHAHPLVDSELPSGYNVLLNIPVEREFYKPKVKELIDDFLCTYPIEVNVDATALNEDTLDYLAYSTRDVLECRKSTLPEQKIPETQDTAIEKISQRGSIARIVMDSVKVVPYLKASQLPENGSVRSKLLEVYQTLEKELLENFNTASNFGVSFAEIRTFYETVKESALSYPFRPTRKEKLDYAHRTGEILTRWFAPSDLFVFVY